MSDLESLLDSLERDFADSSGLMEGSRNLHQALPTPFRDALFPAMRFFGAAGESGGTEGVAEVDRVLRHRIARLILRRLRADTDDPRWSSSLLGSPTGC